MWKSYLTQSGEWRRLSPVSNIKYVWHARFLLHRKKERTFNLAKSYFGKLFLIERLMALKNFFFFFLEIFSHMHYTELIRITWLKWFYFISHECIQAAYLTPLTLPHTHNWEVNGALWGRVSSTNTRPITLYCNISQTLHLGHTFREIGQNAGARSFIHLIRVKIMFHAKPTSFMYASCHWLIHPH